MDLNKLKSKEPIIIVGHENMDFDSILSCYLFSLILKRNKIKYRIKSWDKNIDDKIKLFDFNINIEDDLINENDSLFLLDCCKEFSNTIGCIDHHKPFISTGNYLYKKSSSCSKIIYDMMDVKDKTSDILMAVIMSIFTDTDGLISEKLLIEDKCWVEKMIEEHGFDYDWFLENSVEYFSEDNITSQTLYNDLKIHGLGNGKYFKSSHINIIDSISPNIIKVIITEAQEKINDENIAWLFLITNIKTKKKEEYRIFKDNVQCIFHNKVYSRGITLVPSFIKFLNLNFELDTLISLMIKNNYTITTMESCTSGLLASTITDIEGASAIFEGAFITYSNESKINAGVVKGIIDKYGVYSKEVATDMAENAKIKQHAKIGIGVTGTFGNCDPNNISIPGEVYFSIKCINKILKMKYVFGNINPRIEMKKGIVNIILKYLQVFLLEYKKEP